MTSVTRDRTESPPADNGQRPAPVIVLTYAESGAGRLSSLLADHPDLSLTSATGLLPLCQQAAQTWQRADKRDFSALAATSTRAIASSVIISILASTGRPRWCEISTAHTDSAEIFLRLFPRTRFLCMHRSCADVIYSGLAANPWGLAESVFWPFAQRFPGNNVAPVAAYWAAHTEQLLEFEENHRTACGRVRYEDLVTEPAETAGRICEFLGLDSDDWPGREVAGAPGPPDHPDAPGGGAGVPSRMLPPALFDQVNKLLAKLAYPPLTGHPSGRPD
jgi:hypothetical protein